MKTDWRAVLRDALAVLLAGFLGGVIGRKIGGESNLGILMLFVVILMTAGFCVSGCLAKQARFRHLTLVAAGVWLISTIARAVSTGGTFVWSMTDVGLIVAAMLLGGLVSLAIVKTPPAAPPPAPEPPASPPPD
jgi:hypothetical protein